MCNMEFSVRPYSVEDLTEALRPQELKETEHIFLQLDYRHSGLGTHSCGERAQMQYRLNQQEYNWEFELKLI